MKKMCFVLLASIYLDADSQVVLTPGSPIQLLDFSASMPAAAGSSGGSAFSSVGFEPDPTIAGRLNSNAWAFTGWSDGSLLFGGSRITASTDYTRGSTLNAVSTGGIYAFTGSPVSVSNPLLLLQPGGADWAPGSMTLRIKNGSAVIIQSLTIQYDLYVRNDQGRSSSFLFSYSLNDINYMAAPSLDYISPAAPDANGLVHIGGSPSRSMTISGLAIAPGANYYLRWNSEDVSGSGARDEFGLDNILVSADFAQSPLPVSLLDFRVYPLQEYNLVSWRTVFEQNNRGFELQRSGNGIEFTTIDFIPSMVVSGNSLEAFSYSFLEKRVSGKSWFYRLKQIDFDGRSNYSEVIYCRRNSTGKLEVQLVYPNPASSKSWIQVQVDLPGIYLIKVFTVSGQLLIENTNYLKTGVNRIGLNSDKWPAGSYWVCFYSPDGILLETKRMLRI
jgi:hypothetical protein